MIPQSIALILTSRRPPSLFSFFFLSFLQHVNRCNIFNVQSCLSIYIEIIEFLNEQFIGNNKQMNITGSLAKRIECSPNGPLVHRSIPGRVISKTLKIVLETSCLTLNDIRYVSRVKWSNSGKWAAPSPTPRCSSYWNGSLKVTNFTLLYLYIS